ncbi:MAG: NAD(P)/FAD-dependent oxidoreductase [Leptothrix sp. (in: b-proteobacteria)]
MPEFNPTPDERPCERVAVVGAGLAGLSCARALAEAGCSVELFDKSRGVGGRMATRRSDWRDGEGAPVEIAFDHGVSGFVARSPAFVLAVEDAHRQGWLARWEPSVAPGSRALFDAAPDAAAWVCVPDMPAWCRQLQADLPLHRAQAVECLQRDAGGWRLSVAGAAHAAGHEAAFDAVVLAMPPAQAAALLLPHRPDWAEHARQVTMQPCWTLMGLTDAEADLPDWHVSRPHSGALDWVIRHDRKPGRSAPRGQAAWVLHASVAWTEAHLQADVDSARAALQDELARLLGRPLTWRHAVTHCWLYARPAGHPTNGTNPLAHWDASLGLGVCGDFLGPACGDEMAALGVERAWMSGHGLGRQMAQSLRSGAKPVAPLALGGEPT